MVEFLLLQLQMERRCKRIEARFQHWRMVGVSEV